MLCVLLGVYKTMSVVKCTHIIAGSIPMSLALVAASIREVPTYTLVLSPSLAFLIHHDRVVCIHARHFVWNPCLSSWSFLDVIITWVLHGKWCRFPTKLIITVCCRCCHREGSHSEDAHTLKYRVCKSTMPICSIWGPKHTTYHWVPNKSQLF